MFSSILIKEHDHDQGEVGGYSMNTVIGLAFLHLRRKRGSSQMRKKHEKVNGETL